MKYAKEQYEALGIDVDAVVSKLKQVPISLHCWQGDDVGGFEAPEAELGGGGIQVTGNYPGMTEVRPGTYVFNDSKYYLIMPDNICHKKPLKLIIQ